MAKLLALYKHPQDPAQFDAHYYGIHVPLAKTIGGLRKYEVSAGPVATPQGTSQYHLVAELTFDSIGPAGVRDERGLGTFAQSSTFTIALRNQLPTRRNRVMSEDPPPRANRVPFAKSAPATSAAT